MKLLIYGFLTTFVNGDCTLLNGHNLIGAPTYICKVLDSNSQRDYRNRCRAWRSKNGPKPECCTECEADWRKCVEVCGSEMELYPEELKDFSCDPVQELKNGNIYCTDGAKTGSMCVATCDNSFELKPKSKQKCKPRKQWMKAVEGKAPVKWNIGELKFECIKHYEPSPCETENGGCSHECIDPGSGSHQCVCPCGYTLQSDLKTCIIKKEICPFDISFFVDKTKPVCSDAEFKSSQANDLAAVIQFFQQELRTRDGKMALGFFSNGRVLPISHLNQTHSVTEILGKFAEANQKLKCGKSRMGAIFDTFGENDRLPGTEVSTVTVLSLAGELVDTEGDLLTNRPVSDSVLVLTNSKVTTAKYQMQAKSLACGTAECNGLLPIGNFSAADVESRISRSECYNRVFSSSITCTEFSMELKIPICALKGLGLSDVVFNDAENCNAVTSVDETHYQWDIDYNDCGTSKIYNEQTTNGSFPAALTGTFGKHLGTGDDGIITYENRLKTKIVETGWVKPVMPIFDVPLQCGVLTTYNFVFTGDWEPDISSFQAEVSAHFELDGDVLLFHDDEFSIEFDNNTTIQNGKLIFVESRLEVPAEYDPESVILVSCIASPGLLDAMQPINLNDPFWMLVDDGCIKDKTLMILPRGPNGEIRLSFQAFSFKENPSTTINMQCKFKTCDRETINCSDNLPMCSSEEI